MKSQKIIYYLSLAALLPAAGCVVVTGRHPAEGNRSWGLISPLSATVLILASGCAFHRSHTDPLAAWHFSSLNNLRSNDVIKHDYEEYVRKLSPQERRNVGTIKFFADGTGGHAVRIEIGLKGTWWEHVLIYDKDDRRVRSFEYASGGYRS